MKNWTIGRRIITGGTILMVLLLIVGGVGNFALKKIERLATDRLLNDAVPGIIAMSEISTATMNAQIHALMASDCTDPVDLSRQMELLGKNSAAVNTAMNAYEITIRAPEDRQNFEQLKQKREAYRALRDRYLAVAKEGKTKDASAFLLQQLEPVFIDYRDHTLVMLKWNQDAANHATREVVDLTAHASFIATWLTVTGLLAASATGWFIIRGVNRLLRHISLNLADSGAQVGSAAGQVSASSQALAEGASEQAASLEETSSSLEELSSMTKRNADSAVSAKALSAEARGAAEAGNADMGEMKKAMDAIKTSSNDIAKIIRTIDEIAFQTNILALNAAVEAARAGEAGAGFAVVADEVRALAHRSAASAKETAAKIEVAIQSGEHGVQISEKIAGSLVVIVDRARKVDELVAEIATASNEQNQGIDQINNAVSQMDKVTQSNAASAEETAAAAEQLNAQSASLEDAVGDLQRLVHGTTGARVDSTVPSPNLKPASPVRGGKKASLPAEFKKRAGENLARY